MGDEKFLGVSSVPIADGIGVTLVRVENGWRFHGWHRDGDSDEADLIQPLEEDRARFFSSIDDAGAYFRDRYAALLIRRKR